MAEICSSFCMTTTMDNDDAKAVTIPPVFSKTAELYTFNPFPND